MTAREQLGQLFAERIVILDGAWGTMIQGAGLAPEDYRGERFADHPRDVAGDPDVLALTRPELLREIHDAYFAAGADITTTNTFTSTSIGQADYGLEGHIREINLEAARIARAACDAAARRREAALRRRLGRSAQRDAVALADGSTIRPTGLAPSTRSAPRTPSRSRHSRRAASICSCSRRSSTR